MLTFRFIMTMEWKMMYFVMNANGNTKSTHSIQFIRKHWRQIMTTVLKKTNISGYCSFGKTHPEHNY